MNVTKFKIRMHHRYELREWIEENFPFVRKKHLGNYSPNELKLLESRASEIVDACSMVEQIDLES